jgi:hypothetical protein
MFSQGSAGLGLAPQVLGGPQQGGPLAGFTLAPQMIISGFPGVDLASLGGMVGSRAVRGAVVALRAGCSAAAHPPPLLDAQDVSGLAMLPPGTAVPVMATPGGGLAPMGALGGGGGAPQLGHGGDDFYGADPQGNQFYKTRMCHKCAAWEAGNWGLRAF